MFTSTNLTKKSKQRHLSEIDFNSFGNTYSNFGHKIITGYKSKRTILHSPFHNSLLSSLNLHTDENMNRTQKENIFNKDFIIKNRYDRVVRKKRFNMLSETEENLLTTAIQKRKEVFPKIVNISKYSSKSHIKTLLSNKKMLKPKNQIQNDKSNQLLGNILVVQKIDFIHNRINHRKNFSFNYNNPKHLNDYYTNIIKDDLDYMAI